MYNAFFGISENPFSLSPDPTFLYRSPQHEEALAVALDEAVGEIGAKFFDSFNGEETTPGVEQAHARELGDRLNEP